VLIVSPIGIIKRKPWEVEHVIRKAGISQILLQSMPLLALSMLGELLTGLTLSFKINEVLLIPSLITLVPAISDLRGDVGTTLGSRLSILLYEGRLERLKILLWNNVGSSIILSVLVSLPIGFLAHVSSILLGLPSVGFVQLVMISLSSTLIASIFLSSITVITTFVSFRHGIDPDNVVAPSLATIGDIITILTILLAARLVTAFFNMCLIFIETTLAILFILFCILELFARKKSKYSLIRPGEKPSRIILESAPMLFISAAVGIVSGSILHMKVESLSLRPALVALIPLVVADAGIIGSIFGARLSSALHLGEIEAFKWSRLFLKNTVAIFILGNASSILIGFLVFAAFTVSKVSVLNLSAMLVFSFYVCFITTVVMMVLTTLIAFESFRRGLDPSNVVIPIMTSLGDVIGVFSLVGIASIQGYI